MDFHFHYTCPGQRRQIGIDDMSNQMSLQDLPRYTPFYMPSSQNQQQAYPAAYTEQGYQPTYTQRLDQGQYAGQAYQAFPPEQPTHHYHQYHPQFQPSFPSVRQQRPASWPPLTHLPSPPVDVDCTLDRSFQWPPSAQYGQQPGSQQSYQPSHTSQQESYQSSYHPCSPQYPEYPAPAAPSPEWSPSSPTRYVSTNQSPLATQQSSLPGHTPRSPQYPYYPAQHAPSPEYSPPSPTMRDGSMDSSPLAMSQRSVSVESNPPTPSDFTTQPYQAAASEPNFQVLDEPEEEGEVLVGLGLYDTPGKYNEKPVYMLHGFSELGMPMLPHEQSSQGLKLAQAWTPPSIPVNEEEEDEDEEDEEEDEE